jgi:hypothetical protein
MSRSDREGSPFLPATQQSVEVPLEFMEAASGVRGTDDLSPDPVLRFTELQPVGKAECGISTPVHYPILRIHPEISW